MRFDVTDRKGSWSILTVQRTRYIGQQYQVLCEFAPNPNGVQKETGRRCGYVFIHVDDTQPHVTRNLKTKLGYTPTPAAAGSLFKRMQERIRELREEDQTFATADRAGALAVQEVLIKRACSRCMSGEALPPLSSNLQPWWYRMVARWLTADEWTEAAEAQKVIQGHAYVGPDHLRPFAELVRKGIEQTECFIQAQAKTARRQAFRILLETDPEFRRLVAHYEAARAQARGCTEYELMYRIFGYCRTLDAVQRIRPSLVEMLAPYGLVPDQVDELSGLADPGEMEWNCLPVVTPPFERKNGAFYYYDRVYVTDTGTKEKPRVYHVDRATLHNVYLSGGAGRVPRDRCRHVYDPVGLTVLTENVTLALDENPYEQRGDIPDAFQSEST